MAVKRGIGLFSLAAELLQEIAKDHDAFSAAMRRPGKALYYGGIHGFEEYNEEKRWRAKRLALQRLARAELIQMNKTSEGLRIALTAKGAFESIRQEIIHAPVIEGNYDCVVIFDVPERHRKVRDELRSFLSKSGFVQIQKSVFVSPYDAFVPLVRLFEAKDVQRWIRVYKATLVS